ncbi:MAG: cytochrome c family protein [Deltaproteobacteria bacterium]|nr:cytochrome c family protein [Deltaproteobacteria bacterium]
MFKKLFLFTITLFVAISFSGIAWSADQGNKRKGKYTYRKVYKACFERGEVAMARPKVNPDAHTQAEWIQIFQEKAFAEFGCAPEWENLEEPQLLDIYAYLHAHASDSPTPAKCK